MVDWRVIELSGALPEMKRQYAAHYLDLMIERYRGFETKSAEILGFIVITETIIVVLTQGSGLAGTVRIGVIVAGILLFASALFCVLILWPQALAYPGPSLDEAIETLKSVETRDLDAQVLDWYSEAAKMIDPVLMSKARLFKLTCASALLGIASLLLVLVEVAVEIFKS